MNRLLNFAIIAVIALTGCSKAINQKPALPSVANAVLISTLQKHFDDYRTCAVLPFQFRHLSRGPKFRIRIEQLEQINADPKKSIQPFIDFGLIRVGETPKDQADKFVYFELTEIGRSSYSRSCRGWNEMRGESFKTSGFPVFDIRIEKILSSRTPGLSCYVWSTSAKYQFRIENFSPWYDPQVFQPYVSRELSPQHDGAKFVWDERFYKFRGDWRLGAYDFIHSNLVCPERIDD